MVVKKVLVLIASAGVDPWLSIEEQGQKATFAQDRPGFRFLWIEGDASLAERHVYRMADWILKIYHRSFWGTLGSIKLRKVFPFGLVLWVVNALFRRGKAPLQGPKLWLPDLSKWRARSFANSSKLPLPCLLVARLFHRDGLDFSWVSVRRLRQRFPNLLHLTPIRGLKSLEVALSLEHFDYLVRITSTEYVHMDNLRTYIDGLGDRRIYAGQPLVLAGADFVGGSFIIFSRDVVQEIVNHGRRFRIDTYDDVAIGRIVSDFNLAPLQALPQIVVRDTPGWETNLPTHWHNQISFGCKTGDLTTDVLGPVHNMRKLHYLLSVKEA